MHRAHCIRTVATMSGQTPVHHPKMNPPKQPIEPQKTSDASTPPVFHDCFTWLTINPRGFWVVFILSRRPLDGCNDHREGPQIYPKCAPRPHRARTLCAMGMNMDLRRELKTAKSSSMEPHRGGTIGVPGSYLSPPLAIPPPPALWGGRSLGPKK